MTFEFNCEEFAQQLTDEASKYVAENMTDEDRKFVLEHFYDCALRSARVLSQDKTLELSKEEVVYVADAMYYDNTSTKEFTEKIRTVVEELKNEHKKKEEL